MEDIFTIASRITRDHAAALAADPTLAARLDAVPCYIDPTLPIINIARALATEGMCLTNDDRGHLMITRLEGYVPPVRKVMDGANIDWWAEQRRIQEGGATETAEVTEERSRD